jgi:hypothetical protein
MTGRRSAIQPCSRRVIRSPERYIVGDTPTNLEASVTIEMPDLQRTLVNCSSVSLSRLRRILTCTLSLKFNELRKWVGFDLFMMFLLLGGMG